MAFRADLFKKYGRFNTDLIYRSDDKYIFDKLKNNKVKVLYSPDVFVNHFIDESRTQYESIKKISRSIGAGERLKLKSESDYKILIKIIEYVYKFGGSLFLGLYFLSKGQPSKGLYCIKVMKNTIIGFIRPKLNAKL